MFDAYGSFKAHENLKWPEREYGTLIYSLKKIKYFPSVIIFYTKAINLMENYVN